MNAVPVSRLEVPRSSVTPRVKRLEGRLKGHRFLFLIVAFGAFMRMVELLLGGRGLEAAAMDERVVAALWPLAYGLTLAWCFRAASRRPVLAFGVAIVPQAVQSVFVLVEQGWLGLGSLVLLYFLFVLPFLAARELEKLRREQDATRVEASA